jgi:hypothetical protein
LDAIAQKPEGEMTIIDVQLPKPVADQTPVPKQIYATRVKDLICGVGYYYWFNEKN